MARRLTSRLARTLANADLAGADILPSLTGANGKPDAATRLKQVKALYDQGLINKDDYDKKVKEIMDSL